MAFAIFLEDADLAAMETTLNDARLTGKQRNDGRVYWNGGLSGWRTAPVWPTIYPGADATTGRIIVITGATLDSFRTYLYGLSTQSPAVADYVRKLADWFGDHWGAVEPWPYTSGQDPWPGYVRTPPSPATTTTPVPPVTTTTAHP